MDWLKFCCQTQSITKTAHTTPFHYCFTAIPLITICPASKRNTSYTYMHVLETSDKTVHFIMTGGEKECVFSSM